MGRKGFVILVAAILVALVIVLLGVWYLTTRQALKRSGALPNIFSTPTITSAFPFIVDNTFSFTPPKGWTQKNSLDIWDFSDAEGNAVSLNVQWEGAGYIPDAFGSGAQLLGHLKNDTGDYYSQIDNGTLTSIGIILHLPGRDMLYNVDFDFGSHQYSNAEYAEVVDLISTVTPLPSAMISRTYHFTAGPFSVDTSTPTISGPYRGKDAFGIVVVPFIQSWGRTGNFASFPGAVWSDISDHGGTLSLSSSTFSDDVGTILQPGTYSVGLYTYQNIYDPSYEGDTLPTLVATGTLIVE